MCGRFVASRPVSEIAEIFDVDEIDVPDDLLAPRYNVAPSTGVLGINMRVRHHSDAQAPDPMASAEPAGHGEPNPRELAPDGEDPSSAPHRRLTDYRWGLVPSWSKIVSSDARTFNARAETLLEKPSFRTALQRRRLIVPADAFYEWKRLPGPGLRSVREPWKEHAKCGRARSERRRPVTGST